jgi:hypothetical protein
MNSASKASSMVSSVTVAPNTVDMWKGRTQDFAAIVEGINDPDQSVTWSVSGNSSAETKFQDNILYTAADETAEHFKVTATSTVDTAKSGSSTVNIVRPIVTGVTILQQDAAIQKGGSLEFNAIVEGPRGPDQDVVWSVEGNSSADTKFEANKLTIAADETNISWTVKATSYFDGEHSGAVTVNLAHKIISFHNTKGMILATWQGLLSEFAPAGREITLTVKPAPQFKLTGLNYSYESQPRNNININTRTFIMPAFDVTISAEFGNFVIGDRGPGGGWIFYVEKDAARAISQNWKYLECAPTDTGSAKVPWGPQSIVGVAVITETYGRGKEFTRTILSKSGSYPAAASAVAYRSNGLTDWYLPNEKEWGELIKVLKRDSEFFNSLKDDYYWSSSEEIVFKASERGKRAVAVNPTKNSVNVKKATPLYVRPIRQF